MFQVRRVCAQQQSEKCRVLQDALHVLARQHHDLEQLSLAPQGGATSCHSLSDEESFHDAMEYTGKLHMYRVHVLVQNLNGRDKQKIWQQVP